MLRCSGSLLSSVTPAQAVRLRRCYFDFLRRNPDACFKLFVAGGPASAAELSAELFDILMEMSLLVPSGKNPDLFVSVIRLFVFHELLIATDHLRYVEPSHAEGMVMPMHPENSVLIEAIPRRSGARVLDIGFGSGVLGFVALKRGAASLVGLEVSSRCCRFATLNALLNNLDTALIEWRLNPELTLGGILHSVQGEQFDLIVCNPPFEVGRDTLSSSVTCANGGADGLAYFHELLPRIVEYLTSNGEAHFVFFSVGDSRSPKGILDIAHRCKGAVALSWVANSLDTSAFVKWNTGEQRQFIAAESRLWIGRIAVRRSELPALVESVLPEIENWHFPIFGSTPIGVDPWQ